MNAYNLMMPESPVSCIKDELEMVRLLNAALVDRQFCDLLLRDPSSALEKDFYGKTFRLSARERQFVLTVKATSLTNFAAQWVSCVE